MKAEDLEKQLKEFYTTNKESKGSGFGKRIIELYARIQIEKDREQIKSIKKPIGPCSWSVKEEYLNFKEGIDSLPINLD